MPCRHRLLLLDCCFSGALFGFDRPLAARPVPEIPVGPKRGDGDATGPTGLNRGDGPGTRRVTGEIDYYLGAEAFVGMTAGLGDQPVADGSERDRHSLFTSALLQAMRERANSPRQNHAFTFTELTAVVRPRVTGEVLRRNTLSDQIPMAGRLEPGEGDFVFQQTRDVEVPWERAEREARESESRRVAALSNSARPVRLDQAMLLALEASRTDTFEALSSLQRCIDNRPEVSRFLDIPEGWVTGVAFGPGGTIAAGYYRAYVDGGVGGGVLLLDPKGEQLRTVPIEVKEGAVTGVAFGPGGTIAAGFSRGMFDYGVVGGGVVLLDPKGERLRTVPIEVKEGSVMCVAFGPGGTIAAGYARVGGSGGVLLLDPKGERLRAVPIEVKEGWVTSVAFGPGGTIAAGFSRGAYVDGGVVLLDPKGERLRAVPIVVKEGGVASVAFGPGGTIAAGYRRGVYVYGGVGGGVVLLDPKGERLRAVPIVVKEGWVTGVAFGPGGTIAAGFSRGVDGGVLLLDPKGERLRADPIEVKEGWVTGVAFGPGGTIAAGYARSGVGGVGGVWVGGGVVLLDPKGERLRTVPIKIKEGGVNSVAFGPGGTIAAEYRRGFDGGVDGGVLLLDPKGERLRTVPIKIKEGGVASVAFGPGGTIAAGYARVGGSGGVLLLDPKGERLRAVPIEVKEGWVTSVAFGPGGTIAAGYAHRGWVDGGVLLLDPKGERLRAVPIEVKEGAVNSVAFGPGGTIAAGFSRGVVGGVVLLDPKGERLRANPIVVKEGGVASVAFGPGGTIAAGYDRGPGGGVVLLDPKGERLGANPIEVMESGVTSVAFGPGGTIAAGFSRRGFDGGVVLLDPKEERLRADPIVVKEGFVASVAFGPGGTIAAGYSRYAGFGGGGVVLLDGDPASWRGKAEQVANRNFTRGEWREFFPNTSYRRTIRTLPWPHDLPDSERKRAESAEDHRPEGDVEP